MHPKPKRKCTGHSTDKALLHGCKSRAKRKGVPFDLSIEDVRAVRYAGSCHYCQRELSHAELDRVDPTLGYVPTNLVPACRPCNTLKSNVLSHDQMVSVVTAMRSLGLPY
jgi:5-methylcytosine-specific restriction endonuclease McrA